MTLGESHVRTGDETGEGNTFHSHHLSRVMYSPRLWRVPGWPVNPERATGRPGRSRASGHPNSRLSPDRFGIGEAESGAFQIAMTRRPEFCLAAYQFASQLTGIPKPTEQ